ncbi:hypothetical protein HPB48_003591 [Haemaphysalis longicornis]|uniref:PDZ domain-containing protein n=1 Tax=Haemaphysalis longicornis TaxID=44386 RepID=A0A9J6F721_HAELO|nr:hypothetical protein HPB48_003591 [Haemaphysalis longicornis]
MVTSVFFFLIHLLHPVNPGSLAEKGGLQTGDALLYIQGKSTDQLRHKEAQDAIMRAGNYLELQVTR